MAVDSVLAARVRARLSGRSAVAERRMMGGLCFMVAGHMCCGVSGGRLMVRVGREAYEAVLAEPLVQPLDLGGRRPIGYVRIAPEGVAGEAELGWWLERALAAVADLPAREPAPKRETIAPAATTVGRAGSTIERRPTRR